MIRLASILLIVFAIPVAADPIVLRSGLHDTFTRLVFSGNRLPAPTIRTENGDTVIEFAGHSDGFETDQVFDRITRTRLEAVESDTSSVRLSLNCACEITDFALSGGLHVIDLNDPEFASQATTDPDIDPIETLKIFDRQETSAEPAVEIGIPELDLFGTLTLPPARQPEIQPVENMRDIPGPPVELPLLARQGRPAQIPVVNLSVSPPAVSAPHEPQSDNDASKTVLAMSLGSASTRGVLDANTAFRDEPEPAETVAQDSDAVGDGAPAALNIAIVQDLQQRQLGSAVTLTRETSVDCPDPRHFDIGSWGPLGGFSEDVADRRRRLVQEFDTVTEDDQIELAKAYIHYGFGAEAADAIADLPSDHETAQILRDLSLLIDGEDLEDPAGFATYRSCGKRAALWASLATQDNVTFDEETAQSALIALNELPLHLRLILAPRLSSAFSDWGKDGPARIAIRTSTRTKAAQPDHVQLISARRDAEDNEIRAAVATLSELATANSPESLAALESAIEIQISSDLPIATELIDLLKSYLFEYRDVPKSSDLQKLLIKAHIHSGTFESAINELETGMPLGNERTPLVKGLLVAALEAESDLDFLQVAYFFVSESAVAPGFAESRAVMDRLKALGFDDLAGSFASAKSPVESSDRDVTSTGTITQFDSREIEPRAAKSDPALVPDGPQKSDDPGLLSVQSQIPNAGPVRSPLLRLEESASATIDSGITTPLREQAAAEGESKKNNEYQRAQNASNATRQLIETIGDVVNAAVPGT